MLELWGGIECTVNRVGDRYVDQVVLTGHQQRLDDLDRFADLGIKALRYPVLWERVVPTDPAQPDWSWTDERLARLRELGIRPIIGLCHHGSGPRWTGLLDPKFPHHLARYARAVSERYPWVDAFTPINEPLTTARFAALYGHWHPHARDEQQMVRALVHQCRAVQLAMREIRQVNPNAQLVQTEDLGRVWSTPPLRYQADYENERRWLSLDFLCGRVGKEHPLWQHLWWLGLTWEELGPLLEQPCPPDIIGGNYYVTSERFLDHRRRRYPAATHGGNGRHAYADVETVRVLADWSPGPASLLEEAWQRYGRPVAIT
jgi:dTDP-4-dehydrorhamnose reductase